MTTRPVRLPIFPTSDTRTLAEDTSGQALVELMPPCWSGAALDAIWRTPLPEACPDQT